METSYQAYLLLGSNRGNRELMLSKAKDCIENRIGVIITWSSIYESEAWGEKSSNPYLNQAIEISTSLSPESLLKEILKIELDMGREKRAKWEDRIIDIDILFFGNQVIQTPNLVVPHPWIQDRNFTLVPLMEIAPDHIHPVFNKRIEELYFESKDNLEVDIYG